jgi:hypothetical protein
MIRLFVRRLLLAGGTVAVLGLAVVGVNAVAGNPAGSPGTGTDAVATAADMLLAADTTSGATPDRLSARQLRRLAAWDRLVHATATLDLPALGGLTTVQLDHGTVSAASSSSLTIAEAGGGSVTITLGDETRVRKAGAKAAIADLKAGDEVFAMSRVGTAGSEAYLVVVPKR